MESCGLGTMAMKQIKISVKEDSMSQEKPNEAKFVHWDFRISKEQWLLYAPYSLLFEMNVY